MCTLNKYIVLAKQEDVGRVGECRDCPYLSTCFDNGTITAAAATYLLIDQSDGTLSSISCSHSACIDGGVCLEQIGFEAVASMAQLVIASHLSVLNCCGPGRWPAYVPVAALYDGVDSLMATQGHNILCASCLPGHSSVNGRCIPCSKTNYGYLFLIVLMALLLVWLVQRVPHDWTGSASVLIVVRPWAYSQPPPNLHAGVHKQRHQRRDDEGDRCCHDPVVDEWRRIRGHQSTL